jgi:hypothetical protein
MSQMTTKQYAENLLDRLISLDDQMTSAFFEMGQILSAIEHGKLYEILGYESFAHLIEEEMSFTSGTAGKYFHTYRHFKRLGYNKTEALAMIKDFSFTRVAEYVSQATTKVSKRAVANAIQRNLDNKRQINFTVNAEEYELVQQALHKNGADITDTGRWLHSSEAFIGIIKDAARKPQLKAVS